MKIKIGFEVVLNLGELMRYFDDKPAGRVILEPKMFCERFRNITNCKADVSDCGECRPDLTHSTCPGCGKHQ